MVGQQSARDAAGATHLHARSPGSLLARRATPPAEGLIEPLTLPDEEASELLMYAPPEYAPPEAQL
jgi:hypothetical protein